MRNLRCFVCLLLIICGTLSSFGCTVNVETEDSTVKTKKKKERKIDPMEGWGEGRTEHRPPRPMP